MEKKFAILGDIHANIDALESVLADAREQGATDYVCVGDIIGYNAAPRECIETIRALPCQTVRGNHDHYCAYAETLEDFHPVAANVIEWTRRQLTEDHLQWLYDLPLTATVGGAFLMVHSTLDMPERWGYVFDNLEAAAHLSYQMHVLCFHGHTHVPTVFEKELEVVRRPPESLKLQLGKKYFINTGSVGQPRDGDPRASYCLYQPKAREVTFRRVAYDVEAAQGKITAAGLPERLAVRLAQGR
ncbi:MAG: metallophosphatase family protein [Kiritimatiellaeota bacterium]|nr:metallophosphatase family protein [Kiritimatiellota bacterium]